jgi:hypothetical protein
MATYDVVANEEGLEVTSTPSELARQLGDSTSTSQYVALTGETFIAVEAQDGYHPALTFLGDGDYLHGGRAPARVRSGD